MSENRNRYDTRLWERMRAESCESCLQNPAEFIVHETFVCVDCAKAAR